jgi:hypothetical protein
MRAAATPAAKGTRRPSAWNRLARIARKAGHEAWIMEAIRGLYCLLDVSSHGAALLHLLYFTLSCPVGTVGPVGLVPPARLPSPLIGPFRCGPLDSTWLSLRLPPLLLLLLPTPPPSRPPPPVAARSNPLIAPCSFAGKEGPKGTPAALGNSTGLPKVWGTSEGRRRHDFSFVV